MIDLFITLAEIVDKHWEYILGFILGFLIIHLTFVLGMIYGGDKGIIYERRRLRKKWFQRRAFTQPLDFIIEELIDFKEPGREENRRLHRKRPGD